MKLDMYQVDAFAEKVFQGNPAAVVPLPAWPEDKIMQAIAAENNLSETAFFVRSGDKFHIRWFTPNKEVDLCGHATLASAFVIFTQLDYDEDEINFESKSGPLKVARAKDGFTLDFPVWGHRKIATDPRVQKALNTDIQELYSGTYWVAVLKMKKQSKSYNRILRL